LGITKTQQKTKKEDQTKQKRERKKKTAKKKKKDKKKEQKRKNKKQSRLSGDVRNIENLNYLLKGFNTRGSAVSEGDYSGGQLMLMRRWLSPCVGGGGGGIQPIPFKSASTGQDLYAGSGTAVLAY